MEVICNSCSAKLTIPDDKLPKNVPVVKGKCPHCQQTIEIRIPQAEAPAPAPEAAAPSAAEPPPPAPAAAPPESLPSAPHADAAPPPAEDFSEGAKLALVCLDQADQQAQVKGELEGAGYRVHVPPKGPDALHWMQRNKYELLILHEEFGGSPEGNLVLKALQPMAMNLRRHICVGLVGKEFRTFSNMAAFAKSVNFVVAEEDLGKIKAITRQAAADNDQFYHVYREALREAGKA